MKLPSDILSRLRASTLQSHRAREGRNRSVVMQWISVIVIGLLLIAAASLYAAHRFYYWSNIEETVASDDTGAASFDEAAVESILKEFEEKASRTRAILNAAPPNDAQATTTDAEAGD